jgi:hypothetical protein
MMGARMFNEKATSKCALILVMHKPLFRRLDGYLDARIRTHKLHVHMISRCMLRIHTHSYVPAELSRAPIGTYQYMVRPGMNTARR